MNKKEIIAALKQAGIPHDPNSKAEDLQALYTAVKAYAKNETGPLEKQLLDLNNQIIELEKPPIDGAETLGDEATVAFNEQVAAKVAAGLDPDQAKSVVKAQMLADAEGE